MATRVLSSRRALLAWRYGLVADRVARWIANRLPRRVAYFALIRGWAYATCGRYGSTVVTEVTADEVVRRWERG